MAAEKVLKGKVMQPRRASGLSTVRKAEGEIKKKLPQGKLQRSSSLPSVSVESEPDSAPPENNVGDESSVKMDHEMLEKLIIVGTGSGMK